MVPVMAGAARGRLCCGLEVVAMLPGDGSGSGSASGQPQYEGAGEAAPQEPPHAEPRTTQSQ